jgi:hypothetical protein
MTRQLATAEELVDVLEVIVAMSGRPHGQIGAPRRAIDHEVGITSVVRQEVEAQELVRRRSDGTVLHVMIRR